ncbi:hypothetical protein NPIL_271631 [Nephila pilipes]|uniref:Uncharacterized protein n=1 Tax=Nephila pilipes TaxID=299642 RepID=A0A8X6UMK4_NEPPI|nr:hypothetical protein NPIL_271631 [Nephila pilipes]
MRGGRQEVSQNTGLPNTELEKDAITSNGISQQSTLSQLADPTKNTAVTTSIKYPVKERGIESPVVQKRVCENPDYYEIIL